MKEPHLLAKLLFFCTCIYKYTRYFRRVRKFNFNHNLDCLLDAAYHAWDYVLKPIQLRSELLEFLNLVQREKPGVVVEIGTANGGTLFLLARLAAADAQIISIDYSPTFSSRIHSSIRACFFKCFFLPTQRFYVINGNSQLEDTKRQVEKILSGRKISLLHIDADHSYSGVKKDFELYHLMVKKGGIIALHDIVHHPEGSVPYLAEVDRFWNETKPGYEHIEIVEDWQQGWAGIGCLLP